MTEMTREGRPRIVRVPCGIEYVPEAAKAHREGGCVSCEKAIERKKSAGERRKHPFTYRGFDLRAEARLYCRKLGITMPSMRIRHGATSGCSGRAWSYMWKQYNGKLVKHRTGVSGRIVVTVGQGATITRVLEVLLHELVHVSCPDAHHSEEFCAKLVRTARELWGVKVEGWLTIERGDRNNRAYAIDDVITKELTELHLAEKITFSLAKIEPAPEPVSLQSRRQELVRKRAEHARKMLERNKRQLLAAQKRVQKWSVKVRYYDKAAAKGRAS